jgi:hypothetical protein
MRTETVNVYQYQELSDSAKAAARDWFRSCADSADMDSVIDDAVRIGSLMGIEITSRAWTNPNGFKGSTPEIYWSGFSSQGDGACFEGRYSYRKGAAKAMRQEAPQDAELYSIVDQLQEIQRRNMYQLTATTKQRGHYQHSGCMVVDVDRADDKAMTDDAEQEVTDLLRRFADWIYHQLEAERDYQNADDTVEDNITANKYDFNADGTIY